MQLLGADIGGDRAFFVIAGPCVIESETLALSTAAELADMARRLGLLLIYKSSFDKANRSSRDSFRGPGLAEGLAILAKVRAVTGLPVLTDVHEVAQVPAVAAAADVLQIPAFLARQTDLVQAAAATGRPVLIKKAQFMAPEDMAAVVAKARAAASAAGVAPYILLCERGTSFGYHTLVSDMRGLEIMAETGCPVVFDATHSVQAPGALGTGSGGDRRFVPTLARAAVAVGIAGLFLETHPDPAAARSDAATQWPLHEVEPLLTRLLAIDAVVKGRA